VTTSIREACMPSLRCSHPAARLSRRSPAPDAVPPARVANADSHAPDATAVMSKSPHLPTTAFPALDYGHPHYATLCAHHTRRGPSTPCAASTSASLIAHIVPVASSHLDRLRRPQRSTPIHTTLPTHNLSHARHPPLPFPLAHDLVLASSRATSYCPCRSRALPVMHQHHAHHQRAASRRRRQSSIVHALFVSSPRPATIFREVPLSGNPRVSVLVCPLLKSESDRFHICTASTA
jgi:hypothetical protein